jgi:hypothetical protein
LSSLGATITGAMITLFQSKTETFIGKKEETHGLKWL